VAEPRIDTVDTGCVEPEVGAVRVVSGDVESGSGCGLGAGGGGVGEGAGAGGGTCGGVGLGDGDGRGVGLVDGDGEGTGDGTGEVDGDGDGRGLGDGDVVGGGVLGGTDCPPHCSSIDATDVAATAASSFAIPVGSFSRKRAKNPSGPSRKIGPETFRSCPAPFSVTNALGVCARA
jgi:hypothetical protein